MVNTSADAAVDSNSRVLYGRANQDANNEQQIQQEEQDDIQTRDVQPSQKEQKVQATGSGLFTWKAVTSKPALLNDIKVLLLASIYPHYSFNSVIFDASYMYF